jgi:integrase
MREPWKRTDRWPYEGRNGKTWMIGYRDHENRVRGKSFVTRRDAEAWMRDYRGAERRSRLREFLEGTDAPVIQPDDSPLGQLLADWLANDAHPDAAGGLARSTWDSYRAIASRHLIGNPVQRLMKATGEVVEVKPAVPPLGERGGYAIGHIPAIEFGSADVLKRWVQAMRNAGVPAPIEERAWSVLSSALSWAVESDEWSVSVNGCLSMQRRRGMRRASRRSGTGAVRSEAQGKRRSALSAWALSPLAVERIRTVMLERVSQRSSLLPLRDATIVSIQYGLAMRNQEVWALRIGDLIGRRASIREVLSYGQLDAGKTAGATGLSRRPPIDLVLTRDLAQWKDALAAHSYPTSSEEFVLSGDLGGHLTPNGHITAAQARRWPARFFTPAVLKVAEEWPDQHADIVGATPYSLRRGMISLRIRAGEDRQAIAKQCGTSVEMLERSYSFAIEDLEDEGPRPAEEERLMARQIAADGRRARQTTVRVSQAGATLARTKPTNIAVTNSSRPVGTDR